MLDILMFREDLGGDVERIRESQRKRNAPMEQVDEVLAKDAEWRTLRHAIDEKRQVANDMQKAITKKRKAKENADEEIAERKVVMEVIAGMEEELAAIEVARDFVLKQIGNLVHESVPVAVDEEKNVVIRTVGEQKMPDVDVIKHHHELFKMIGGFDGERGAKVSGHRGYFLTGPGVLLNQALINYGLAFLGVRGYMPVQAPVLMRKKHMARTAQLSDFDEALYKVVGSDGGEDEDEKYLIATSEQPISAFHADEWVPKADLPLKYAGVSQCFRKEAGKHGKEAQGVYRVHEFPKIEQFILCKPEDSWEHFEAMISSSEEFYQSLGLSYQVISIVSGALNNAAAKKYDLEAWFPTLGVYRELVSCSNCTDYQARDLEVRCGQKQKGDRVKKYVHMLNSTLTATTRTLCCILENYQTNDGIIVPEVLRPFLGGMDFIPFIMPLPKRPKLKSKKKKAPKKTDASAADK